MAKKASNARRYPGRPRKRPTQRKSVFFSVAVDEDTAWLLNRVADTRFNGNVSNFVRAAVDALAAKLGFEKTSARERRELANLMDRRAKWMERAADAAGKTDFFAWAQDLAIQAGEELIGPYPTLPQPEARVVELQQRDWLSRATAAKTDLRTWHQFISLGEKLLGEAFPSFPPEQPPKPRI
jgi:Arc/MetJ-type ribon-helix-helix transcriptional regulator